MAFKIFISYSTKDIAIATQVKKLLSKPKCDIFLAEYSILPGESLNGRITAAIKESDVFILLWSHNAHCSEWVLQEIGIAKAFKKPIIPVVLYQHAELPGFLRGTKYLPLYKNPINGLRWLQQQVFRNATQKEQSNWLMWLGISAAFLWL